MPASLSPTKIAAIDMPELGIPDVISARSLRTLIAALHFSLSIPSPRALLKFITPLARSQSS